MKIGNKLAALAISSIVFSLQAAECDREKLMKGFTPSSNVVFGIGLSGNKDKIKAREESKQRAYQDIVTQLRANVETSMSLEETDKSTAYKGIVNVSTNIEKVVGVKFFKEGKGSNNTSCVAYTFDVSAAYLDAQGFMSVLEKKLEDVFSSQKKKNYVEVVRKYSIAKKEINENEWAILRADMYKTYLKRPGQSYWEKFKLAEVDLDKTYDEAKTNIVFYVNEFPNYEEVVLETETMLGAQGYSVQVGGVKPKTGLEITFKEAGKPKRTRTSLGFTMVYRFGVSIKDIATRRTLGSNKSSTVQGFSSSESEEDALISASKQMGLNVREAIKLATPGLLPE